MTKALFLDRDGVLDALVWRNDEWGAPLVPEQLELLPGVEQALRRAHDAGFRVFVVSNQPNVAKGQATMESVRAVHDKLVAELRGAPVDDWFYCYHQASDRCACRKPSPHFVFEAAEKYGIDLAQSWFAGDQDTDIECGRRAGMRTALLEYARSNHKRGAQRADLIVRDLPELVSRITRPDQPMTSNLRIHLYADGADVRDMLAAAESGIVKGFTTNPTLMRKSGVTDYEAFAREALRCVKGMPISFEVFADEFDEMERQARLIATWGEGVFVKIPITNTRGESSAPLIARLSHAGVKLNITAILTVDQVRDVVDALHADVPAIISVFAGRIADTGRDPIPIMEESLRIAKAKPLAQLLWASPRELLNIFQADACGCHIITVTNDILKKLAMVGKPLDELSLDTVKMFFNDAAAAGFKL